MPLGLIPAYQGNEQGHDMRQNWICRTVANAPSRSFHRTTVSKYDCELSGCLLRTPGVDRRHSSSQRAI